MFKLLGDKTKVKIEIGSYKWELDTKQLDLEKIIDLAVKNLQEYKKSLEKGYL